MLQINVDSLEKQNLILFDHKNDRFSENKGLYFHSSSKLADDFPYDF